MKKNIIIFAKPISWVSLLLIVVPPILFFIESIDLTRMNLFLLAGTIIWFVSASLWMKHE